MNVLVTGGAGYVGCVLVPWLLNAGHRVTVYDTMYFGNALEYDPNVRVHLADIRTPDHLRASLHGQDAVIHLAALSNDESTDADPALGKAINFDALAPLLAAARAAHVERFIFASTSAVYGPTNNGEDVTESHGLNPQWRYAMWKAKCEPIALSYASSDFCVTVLRPAALCGYSPRARLDLTVNLLTAHAVVNGVIEVWGGDQSRCSLHVNDMADAYLTVLEAPADLINGQVFNVGSDNHTVAGLAAIVQKTVLPTPKILVTPAKDDRSYRITSTKMKDVLGWEPMGTIEDAVLDVANAIQDLQIRDALTDEKYYNGRQIAKLIAERPTLAIA